MALDRQILTRTEPTIALDDLQFKSFDEEEGKANVSKDLGGRTPLIHINGYVFQEGDVTSMLLDMNGKIPKITVSITDGSGYFIVDTFPRSGDVLSLRIASRQTDTYKDIRIDFDIDKVVSVPKAAKEQSASGAKYTFTGLMKIPGLFADICKTYEEGSSLDHLEAMATDLQLGFASNVDSPASEDLMKLVVPFKTMSDVIRETVEHSYTGDEGFQTYSIDPYYYLTYVDINKALNSEDDVDMSFASYAESYDENAGEEDDKMMTALVLSTYEQTEGTNHHISKYALKHGAGAVARKEGFKKVLQFYEDNPMHDNGGLGEIRTDVEPISSESLSDIEEPLKGRRGEDRYLSEIKYKYMGRSSNTSNTHPQWKFAETHNSQNMSELNKLSLEVELPVFNPSIYKYQKLPVIIFTEGMEQKMSSDQVETKKEEEGFDNSGTSTSGDIEANAPTTGEQKINSFLTGYYVVGGIQYIYSSRDDAIKQKLILWRREWESRSNNLDGALLDSKPMDTSTPEPIPEPEPIVEEEVVEPEPEPDPEPEPEPESTITLTVTPTTPLTFEVVEDSEEEYPAVLINIRAEGLEPPYGHVGIQMPDWGSEKELYFDFLFPGETEKSWEYGRANFSPEDFPDLPDGVVDIDIEVYPYEVAYEFSGDIVIDAHTETVKIPVDVKFGPGDPISISSVDGRFEHVKKKMGPKKEVVTQRSDTKEILRSPGFSAGSFAEHIRIAEQVLQEGLTNGSIT